MQHLSCSSFLGLCYKSVSSCLQGALETLSGSHTEASGSVKCAAEAVQQLLAHPVAVQLLQAKAEVKVRHLSLLLLTAITTCTCVTLRRNCTDSTLQLVL